MTENPQTESPRSMKPRSPAYPAFGLGAAVEKAELLYKENHTYAVPSATAIKAMGYGSEKSSSGIQALATVLAFGLASADGRGDERKIRVTDEAIVVLNEPAESPRRLATLQELAKRPAAHAALWEKFGAVLPGDNAILSYLTIDLRYLREAAAQLVREYRETFSFARLSESGTIEPAPKPIGEPEGDKREQKPVVKALETSNDGTKQDVFALGRGRIFVEWPESLSEDEVQDVEAWWPIVLRKIKRSVQGQPNDAE